MSQQFHLGKIDVRKFFAQQASYKADLPISMFPRIEEFLTGAAANKDYELSVELNFVKDEGGRYLINGTIQGNLDLPCQRCLKHLPYALDSNLQVQVIEELQESGGERELDEDELDVVLSQQGKLDLRSLIEDEVILSLPIVFYHEERDCNQAYNLLKQGGKDSKLHQEKPFASLEGLKKQLQAEKPDSSD